MKEMQAEIHCLEQLEQRQQMKEKILTLCAKVSPVAAKEDCVMVTPLLQVQQARQRRYPPLPCL
jgi:hypothetical protein